MHPPVFQQISQRFSALDADVTFCSCDGVIFKFYRRNLEIYSEGFAAAEGVVSRPEDIVKLSETAVIVDLLLQFMVPRQPQPVLDNLNFTTIALLAEAVEKYRVFSAMPLCRIYMRNAISIDRREDSARVLAYAIKHDYRDIVDDAAYFTIGQPIDKMISAIPPAYFLPWARYNERWSIALNNAQRYKDPRGASEMDVLTACPMCNIKARAICFLLGGGPSTLQDLPSVFHQKSLCPIQCVDFEDWQESVQEEIERIPQFSEFLYGPITN